MKNNKKAAEDIVEENIDVNEETAEDVENKIDEKAEENVTEESSAEKEDATSKKDKKDLMIEDLTDKYRRLLAEFDNYRKRTEKEKSSMYEMGARDAIEKVLPIVDNFERGFSTVDEEDKEDAFVVGMDKILKQFNQVLENMGVTPIETTDKEFDPNLHNAVMHVDDENYGDNMIVEEFQKGYMYKDNVIRHSMVKVAN